MRLVITPHRGEYRLHSFDDGASFCGKDPNGTPLYAAFVRGSGVADDNVLHVTAEIRCMTHPPTLWETFQFDITYDPFADTLTDGYALFYRVGR